MLTNEGKRKLTAAAMFGLPIALVWLTGQMMGGPSNAEAGETPKLALATLGGGDPVSTVSATPAQAAAAAHIVSLRVQDFGPTPLHHQRQGEQVIVIEDPENAPVPTFRVNMIMASSSGNRAIIDGTSYEVGDELAETGWLVVQIDAVSRSVSIRDPETDRVRTGTVDNRRD